MQKIWFVYDFDKVLGPFLAEEIKNLLRDKRVSDATMVWAKGHKEWIPVQEWVNRLPELTAAQVEKKHDPHWRYREVGHQASKPMSQVDLIQTLKRYDHLDHIELCEGESEAWDSLFTFGEIAEELGHSRRTHSRAPIVGEVEVFIGNQDEPDFKSEAATVSAGGVGLKSTIGLKPGDTVRLVIKCAVLPIPIRTKAKVLYVAPDSFTGLQFLQLNTEASSAIIDYIRMFKNSAPTVTQDKLAA